MNKQDDFDNVKWKNDKSKYPNANEYTDSRKNSNNLVGLLNDNSYKVGEKMFDENDNEIPIVKYKWLVRMEVRPLYFTVEANDAEEAIKLAEKTFTLKKMNIDDVPELECTEATISNVTKDYGKKMNHKWNYKSLGDEE